MPRRPDRSTDHLPTARRAPDGGAGAAQPGRAERLARIPERDGRRCVRRRREVGAQLRGLRRR